MKHLFSDRGCLRCGKKAKDCTVDGNLAPCDARVIRCAHNFATKDRLCSKCGVSQVTAYCCYVADYVADGPLVEV